MTEIEKAKETLEWLDFFDFITTKASMYAYSYTTLKGALKGEINSLRKQCNELIENENKL